METQKQKAEILRQAVEKVNDQAVKLARSLKLSGYYLFRGTDQEDYTKAKSRLEAAKKFQRATKRLTGNTIPLKTVVKFVTPEQRSVIL